MGDLTCVCALMPRYLLSYHALSYHDPWALAPRCSPCVTAGYLPNAPDVIIPQLMNLLHDGEAVLRVPFTPLHVLWRKAMLDPGWQQGCVHHTWSHRVV